MLRTPVVFLIFKRPETTAQVFAAIRQARPTRLLVIADGPRLDRPGEAEQCAATRAILEQVDWDCQVETNYAEHNLGCAKRVASGLTWAFEQVEEAIILEDDCVPHASFFPFCETLLDRYRHDERIMAISGQSVPWYRPWQERSIGPSYSFSHYMLCWGWASWRRAWQQFDFEMQLWPEIQSQGHLDSMLSDRRAIQYWSHLFQATYEGRIDTWDYRWMLACWINSGLTILPHVNLVSNVGFGAEATHTHSQKDHDHANRPTEAIELPLQHPDFILRDGAADDFLQRTFFHPTFGWRMQRKLRKLLTLDQFLHG